MLLVLDEADVFFERQLEEYEERRERCLSFQMRSRFTAMTDEQGLPRLRFVFAGYRVTNRSQGAWSNWGLVLSLDPLDADDAARLVAAPLSVIGVDVGPHAHEIAYRCGYQPAILLRFGQRLVEHLERQTYAPGTRYVVSPAEIAHVLEDQRVHDEIRMIVRNNFEGNPVGLIVFGALLSELLDLPPGQPLRDAPERILERLRRIEADLAWLESEGDGSAAVRGHLAEFVERSLLREHRVGGEPSYTLRFTHHLSILSSLCAPGHIRDEIRRLRGRSGRAHREERALVAPQVLRDLSDAIQPRSGAIGVIGTLWQAGAVDRAGGLPDRLGIPNDELGEARSLFDGGRPPADFRALHRVDATVADHVVAHTSADGSRPLLIGGVDLLRWGLARRREASDLIYEVHGIGRLSPRRLAWWLQRVRALEFARNDGIERIFAKTAGIPVLVEVIDSQLASAAGATVSEELLDLALSAVDEAVPVLARALAHGRPSMALEVREREILQLIEFVVRTDPSSGSDLRSALTECWELFADCCPLPPLSGGDDLPLELLLEAGLLPANAAARSDDPLARLGNVTSGDPIFGIVRAMTSATDRNA